MARYGCVRNTLLEEGTYLPDLDVIAIIVIDANYGHHISTSQLATLRPYSLTPPHERLTIRIIVAPKH
jgi:hypothetical protein